MDQDSSTIAVPAATVSTSVVAGIRRLLIASIAGCFVYAVVTTASRGMCDDGAGSVGRCIQLTLGPSVLVYLAIGIIVLATLGRVINRARDVAEGERIIRRATVVVLVVLAGSAVIANVWFWALPIPDISRGFSILSPIPFGAITVDVEPALP